MVGTKLGSQLGRFQRVARLVTSLVGHRPTGLDQGLFDGAPVAAAHSEPVAIKALPQQRDDLAVAGYFFQ